MMIHFEKKMELNILCDVMSNIEVAVSSSSLGVDNSFRDSLTVELSQLVDEVNVLEKEWSSGASAHRVLIVINWVTSASSQSFSLH